MQIEGEVARYSAPVASSPERRISHTSLLYAASLAKQVTGACFALAVRDGLVSPEDTLAHWFPDLPGWAAGVRLEHLLHHTGALPEEEALLHRMRDCGETARTTPGMLAALRSFTELDDVPGSSYCYSNMGYVCLARIVEIASDETLEAFSERRIFAPLGMTHTRFWRGPDSIPDGAVPVDDEPIVGQPFSLGDGGLWTTADDFLRWNDAMNHDRLGVADLVIQSSPLDDGTPQEYAWGVRLIDHNGHHGLSHGGTWPGIFTKSVRFPGIPASFVAFTLDTDIDPILRLTNLVMDLLVGV